MDAVLATLSVSVTELKRNYASGMIAAADTPVAVLNHNRPEAYLLSAKHYEQLLARLEDLEDVELVRQREQGPFVERTLDDF